LREFLFCRWKIKLREFDYEIKYIKGKENHVADALSRITKNESKDNKIEDVFQQEYDVYTTAATVHSAQEDNGDCIQITERPVNVFNHQLIFEKGNQDTNELTHYFSKFNKIIYSDMTETLAKDIIIKFICGHNFVTYINNDEDFAIFQRAYMKLIKPNTGKKLMKTSVVLPNLPTYADFHEKILEIHEKTIHQGIKKTYETFKTKYYFPDAQKLIQNIINKCEICNLCKAEHRKVALPFEKLQKLKIFAINMFRLLLIDQRKFLTCIDIHSKFISIIETKTTDWIESKKSSS